MLLQEAKEFAGAGSLIPAELTYRDQLNRFKAQTAQAGIDRVHGLRHHYAQARYAELTGWKALAAGGPTSKQLSADQKSIDRQARLTISRELGAHARANYGGVSRAMKWPVCASRAASGRRRTWSMPA